MTLETLWLPGQPCFYLTAVADSEFDALRRTLIDTHPDAVIRLLRGRKSRTTQAFFDEIAAALQFPLYFGENWNALSDCLLDLDWLPGTAYILLINAADDLLADEQEEEVHTLWSVLMRACDEWVEPNRYIPRERPATAFHVILQIDRHRTDGGPALLQRAPESGRRDIVMLDWC